MPVSIRNLIAPTSNSNIPDLPQFFPGQVHHLNRLLWLDTTKFVLIF